MKKVTMINTNAYYALLLEDNGRYYLFKEDESFPRRVVNGEEVQRIADKLGIPDADDNEVFAEFYKSWITTNIKDILFNSSADIEIKFDEAKELLAGCDIITEYIVDPDLPPEIQNVVDQIRSLSTWDIDLCRALCEFVGLEDEWDQADGDTFESVVWKAAEMLGVEVI